MSENTILPWEVTYHHDGGHDIYDASHHYVAHGVRSDNARLIVTAVNSHAAAERLAGAVRKVRKLDQEWQEVTLSKDVVRSHAVYSELEDAKEELDDALAAYESAKGGEQS